MPILTNAKQKMAVAIASGAVVLGGATTAAFAATSSTASSGAATTPSPATASSAVPPATSAVPPATSTTPTTTSSGAKPKGRDRSLLERTDHATVEIKQEGTWVTVTVDVGKVTAVSPASISLARPDGQSVTIALNSSTRFRGGATGGASAIKTGVNARVISEGGAARSVAQRATASTS